MSSVRPPPSSPRSSRTSGNNTATLLVVAVVVAAVIAGFVALSVLVRGPNDTAAAPAGGGASPTPPSATTPVAPTPTSAAPSTGGASNLPVLSCLPAPPLPASPQQFSGPPDPALAQNTTWQVTLQTNCGPIVMQLDGQRAPQTVASFLFLSEKKFYDNTPCHRLTTAGIFVLQCGDPTGTGSGGPGYGYGLENAPASGAYPAGTLAMANSGQPNSNGSQFFIVYADTSLQPGGYSIFGTVVQGLPLVQAIAARGASGGTDGAPTQPVSILTVDVKKL